MTYRSIIFSCFFVSLVLPFAGCGGGEQLPPGMPRLYRAVLTVTQDGAPLAGADVILVSLDPSVNFPASGVTDQNGVLRLRTLGRYDGVPLGRYRVGVQKMESPNVVLPQDSPSNPEEARELRRLLAELEAGVFRVVGEQFAIENTELEIEVTPSNLRFEVDVSPAVRLRPLPPTPGQ